MINKYFQKQKGFKVMVFPFDEERPIFLAFIEFFISLF